MAVSYISPRFYATTDAGAPAVGYKLYTYLTGTTTPAATYQDAGGVSSNTNPIILDARGEAVIFLAAATTYRFVLKTSADVTVWTQDSISSAYNIPAASITTAMIQDEAITSAKLKQTGVVIPNGSTATTPSTGDNSAKIATTAFVNTAVPAASETAAGKVELATQAEVNTGTDTTRVITPATAKAASWAADAWVSFAGATGTIYGSYNVTSITRNSTGDYTINFTSALPTTNYAAVGMVRATGSNTQVVQAKNGGTYSTTALQVVVYENTATPALQDPDRVNIVIFGA